VICGIITGELISQVSFDDISPGEFGAHYIGAMQHGVNKHCYRIIILICNYAYYTIFSHIGNSNSENRSALITAVCLGVALFICLIGLILVVILLIKYKIKFEMAVLNTTAGKVQPRESSVTQNSCISTKKNISYVVHTPRTESDVTSDVL
jgi:uncharacterized membrane protein